MKALFLVFHGFSAYNGISKKIYYQVDALKACGLDVTLCSLTIDENGCQKRMVDDTVLEDYGTGFLAKFKKRLCYGTLLRYIEEQGVRLVYMRYDHNANPFLISLLRKLKSRGVKVVMEIPTYPYDQEYRGTPLAFQLNLLNDKVFRWQLAQQVYRIITFTDYKEIFGAPTINISNGIDFERIKMKSHVSTNPGVVHLIGVAELHFWHGFDRAIKGLANYYQVKQEVQVFFHIVGDSTSATGIQLKKLVADQHLEQYVSFHGACFGEALDELFENADLAIASLARHRSHITKIKTLKNREYAARGLPFVYSETDDDFDHKPFVLKVPADESPLDIRRLIRFYHSHPFLPQEIRGEVIDTLSWKKQMQTILDNTL